MTQSALRRVVVVVGSAGAFTTMVRIVRGLHTPDGACMLLAYHRAGGPRFPWERVNRESGYQTVEAQDDPIRLVPNTVYYPRLAETMLVEDGSVHCVPEPTRPRPNLDRLLTSAAAAYADRVVAFLLSGMGTDGAEGLREIRARGGRTIVEHPLWAAFPQLPNHALGQGAATEALPPDLLVPLALEAMEGDGISPRRTLE